MKRECCHFDCNQGRSCHNRIPTVRPVSARAVDWIERWGWAIAVGVLALAVIANVGA
jgi:hypothetical protein